MFLSVYAGYYGVMKVDVEHDYFHDLVLARVGCSYIEGVVDILYKVFFVSPSINGFFSLSRHK